MLKRKIDLFLEKWKTNPNRKPLIVSGARQIGKTTSIGEFGKNYSSYIQTYIGIDGIAYEKTS